MSAGLSKQAQCARLLEFLQSEGCIATSEARDLLNVMSPAARVLELRRQGHDIVTTWRPVADASGVVHRQGVYALRGGAA